jgi:hypothetical protein
MMSVLLLTFTVSSGFVSNGYHKAYARGNLDALGRKIRESINNQITEELSGSSGLTTPSPSNSTSPIPTTLTLTLFLTPPNIITFQGYLKTVDTGSGIAGASLFLCSTPKECTLVAKNEAPPLARCVTNSDGFYSSMLPSSAECHSFVTPVNTDSVTAQYLGVPGTPEVTIPGTPGIAPSESTQPTPH